MYNEDVATVEEIEQEIARLEDVLADLDPSDPPVFAWIEDNLQWWKEELELINEQD